MTNKEYKRIKANIRKYAIPHDEVLKRYSKQERREIDAGAEYIITLMEIRRLRKKFKLTQTKLAEKSGVPRETISRIESGRRNVTVDTLIKLASAMGKRLEVRLV